MQTLLLFVFQVNMEDIYHREIGVDEVLVEWGIAQAVFDFVFFQ